MKLSFRITGMTCAACAARVEKAAAAVPGVDKAEVNLLQGALRVFASSADVSSGVVEAVVKAGYGASPEGSGNAKPDISPLMELKEDTAFLLCTDGFWEYVYEREMEEALREAREPADWLEKMRGILGKRIPGGNDNFSAAAVFCKAENVCRRG